jgi:hypothetical protein
MAEETKTEETILIKIGETDVEYETNLSLPEVIFWIDILKLMLLKGIIEPE